ncbi:Holliday junction resolvase RuvX [Parachitinimonas caeni]|uniref:Putative pre-16S rRNA nuclease n=1 Tax=Parachitinimonas caeni TaxID=3031301 RepID=A0ABT7DR91_9NEIS|nr:Holliday junction resolvase RuvX [Parachitinimonas caeni]MDK2122582.1 Holliday junction resolvase RuvX [Parachitinimonas caeni]
MPEAGTVLGFDFGERRIGVASGDLMLGIAHPLHTIDAIETEVRFDQIAKLVKEWQPVQLIVGLPSSLDGEEHELSRLARRFARRLHGRFGLPVGMIDERLSSHDASSALNDIGLRGRRQKPVLDQVAAQRILQAYFDDPLRRSVEP